MSVVDSTERESRLALALPGALHHALHGLAFSRPVFLLFFYMCMYLERVCKFDAAATLLQSHDPHRRYPIHPLLPRDPTAMPTAA